MRVGECMVYDFNKIAAMNISETLYHVVMCLASLLLTLRDLKPDNCLFLSDGTMVCSKDIICVTFQY